MARRVHGEDIVWVGGEHRFWMGIGELRALEQRTDAGVAVVLKRLLTGDFKVDDVISTLRLALVGGGLTDRETQRLMDRVMDEANLYTLAITAADVLRRFIWWDDKETPTAGEADAGGTSPTPSRPSETNGQDGTSTTPSAEPPV